MINDLQNIFSEFEINGFGHLFSNLIVRPDTSWSITNQNIYLGDLENYKLDKTKPHATYSEDLDVITIPVLDENSLPGYVVVNYSKQSSRSIERNALAGWLEES